MIVFRDTSGTARLEGDLLAPGGATGDVLTQQADGTYAPDAPTGSTPVACYVTASSVAVATVAQHPVLWSALFDNAYDQNALMAIPAGLGMTFDFDGSDATITTTTAGTWALTFGFVVAPDATFAATVRDSVNVSATLVATGGDFIASLAPTYPLPSGASFAPLVETTTGATGAAVAAVSLTIVRLA